ncbi:MAG: hypothetical protein CL929_03940 [Deltaproteobacteria bacterium]|nr:hypothetical protein [Deltaproteobacteria bacterium]
MSKLEKPSNCSTTSNSNQSTGSRSARNWVVVTTIWLQEADVLDCGARRFLFLNLSSAPIDFPLAADLQYRDRLHSCVFCDREGQFAI